MHLLKKRSIYIYINAKGRANEIEYYFLEDNKSVVVYKNNGKLYSYNQIKIQIVKSALQTQKAERILGYLKEMVETIGLKTDEGNNIFAHSYGSIRFPETSVLSNYLNQKQPEKKGHSSPIEIFPFRFNLSQKKQKFEIQ